MDGRSAFSRQVFTIVHHIQYIDNNNRDNNESHSNKTYMQCACVHCSVAESKMGKVFGCFFLFIFKGAVTTEPIHMPNTLH